METATCAGILIRRAAAADASAVAFVLKQAFAEYRSLYTREGYAATTPEPSEILARMQEGPLWVALWVALNEGQIVGTASAVRKKTGLYIRGMGVLPAARRVGAGRMLLEQAEALAVKEGFKRLFLSTTPFLRRAIQLYERFGFCPVSDAPHDLFGTPLFTMEKTL